MVTQQDTQADEVQPKDRRVLKRRGISTSTFIVSSLLVLAIGFVLGTRSDQLFAAIAPPIADVIWSYPGAISVTSGPRT